MLFGYYNGSLDYALETLQLCIIPRSQLRFFLNLYCLILLMHER